MTINMTFLKVCLAMVLLSVAVPHSVTSDHDNHLAVEKARLSVVTLVKDHFKGHWRDLKIGKSNNFDLFLLDGATVTKASPDLPGHSVDLSDSGVVILVKWMPLLELWTIDHDFPNHGPSRVIPANKHRSQYWLLEPIKAAPEDRGGILAVGVLSNKSEVDSQAIAVAIIKCVVGKYNP